MQVLRVGMHSHDIQFFSHRLGGEGGAIEGVGARYKARAGVGGAQTARVQAQAFVVTARDSSVRIARRLSGKTEQNASNDEKCAKWCRGGGRKRTCLRRGPERRGHRAKVQPILLRQMQLRFEHFRKAVRGCSGESTWRAVCCSNRTRRSTDQ